jgi:hypothetical protein
MMFVAWLAALAVLGAYYLVRTRTATTSRTELTTDPDAD